MWSQYWFELYQRCLYWYSTVSQKWFIMRLFLNCELRSYELRKKHQTLFLYQYFFIYIKYFINFCYCTNNISLNFEKLLCPHICVISCPCRNQALYVVLVEVEVRRLYLYVTWTFCYYLEHLLEHNTYILWSKDTATPIIFKI